MIIFSIIIMINYLAGVGKLYHGVGYCIPRAAIGSGSHFVFYETTRKLLLRNQGVHADTS